MNQTKLSTCTAVLTLLSSLLVIHSYANQYDPHLYPTDGPFFEGWYARLTDSDNERSFGVLFGRVLPKSNTQVVNPLTYLSLIRSVGANTSMEVIDLFPTEANISITVRGGHDVTANPDMSSPAYFEWRAHPYGYFNVTPNSTVFDFCTTSGVRFNGSFGKPVPWGPGGVGPEGWLQNLPFVPLHWFVYSLATPGTYTWTNQNTKEQITGRATMHQEKNWGDSFPPSWIWTEGASTQLSTTYAGSFGVLEFGPLTIPAHLYGYRNYQKNITLNFRPDNSYTKIKMDSCRGKFSVTVVSLRYKVEINIVAPPSTLGKCLYGPTVKGFVPVCVESFVASTETTVYKLTDDGYTKIDYGIIEKAALEFGGDYICSSGPC